MSPSAAASRWAPVVTTRRARVALAVATTLGVLGVSTVGHAEDAASGDAITTSTSAPSPTTSAVTTTTAAPPPTTAPVTALTAPPSSAPTSAPASSAPAQPPETVSTTVAPTTTPAPAPKRVTVYPGQMGHILATIRYLESRGDYAVPPNKGRASGAYQFITSTWDNYGGYSEAYLAPPEVQDERAAADVTKYLRQWDNDVSMIPVMWYYPRASRDAALMDVVPVPSAGNVLTVREYQQRWLAVFAFMSGQPVPQPLTLGDQLARLGVAPSLPPPTPVDPATPAIERTAHVAFPVLGPTRFATPDCGDADDVAANAGARAAPAEIEAAGLCAEEAPAIVFGVKMQPVLAVVDGVVTGVHDRPGEPISVTITDVTGRSYVLAGFNDDTPGTNDGAAPAHLRLTSYARVGQSVRAGQILGFMGDSSPLPLGIRADVPTDATVELPADAIAPHIRLTISDLDGTPVDAYGPVIDALFRQVCSVGIGPWSVMPNGLAHDPVTTETTDDNRKIDSEWVVTDDGRVIASGWAAMIYPSESCGWAPAEKRGPGAGGPVSMPDGWLTPIDLPTSIWVDLAVGDGIEFRAPMMRP